jgi:allophanate hydrolase
VLPDMLDIAALQDLYRSGRTTPPDVAEAVLARIEACPDRAVFITRVSADALRAAARALPRPSEALPLWGVPFAVKDNIDAAGLPTTAACPAFAYDAELDAPVVARLKAAGALLVGKTNLDQFATGLNGTRSPYGAPRCVFDERYVSGGSSSGSAVAVAAGLVSFALGTDTAGSGRVPAAFNNLVGIKPTRGLLSTAGVVPACRSLDCMTVLSLTVEDGLAARRIAEGYDAADPYSRRAVPRALPEDGFRFGVLAPDEREFDGDEGSAALYDAAIERLAGLGGLPVTFDYHPFREAAALLYDGPWVAERLAAIQDFVRARAADMDPTVRGIIEGARRFSAVDAFRGAYALEALRRRTDAEWETVDLLLLPTAPTIYTVQALRADPVGLNARLGRYTNFANLLDCSAIAVPAGFGPNGLPFGVTLVAPAFCDDALGRIAAALHRAGGFGRGRARGDAELVGA